jgi:RNA polymerase sigma factor (TIGR02999 family)
MNLANNAEITKLIRDWREGDAKAGDALLRDIYPVFRAIALKQLRASGNHTLRPTELANDALMQLRDQSGLVIEDRHHFYAIAARAIRFCVIDHQRQRGRAKRGGGLMIESMENLTGEAAETRELFPWMDLERALQKLDEAEPAHVRFVELRFFMGMNLEEASDSLGISRASGVRMWRFARAFLMDYLGAQYI